VTGTEGRLAETEVLLSGTAKDAQGNPMPPPTGEQRFLLEEQRRDRWRAVVAAKALYAEAAAQVRARDDSSRAAAGERVKAEYLKRAKEARRHCEALMRSLVEVRRLAQEGRRSRLLLPVPGPAEPPLRMWLSALDRLDGNDAA
jgi:hypothetical protein